MRVLPDWKLDFDNVLIVPRSSNINSRKDVQLEVEFSPTFKALPLIASNMDTTGTIEMAKTFSKYGALVCLHKFYSEEKLIDFFNSEYKHSAFYTMGITNNDFKKLESVSKSCKLNKICLDVANGYTADFKRAVLKVRFAHPHAVIMAGNVVTAEGTKELMEAGATIVKIGLGSGGVCATRKVTGVGYPQLSAIMESAAQAHRLSRFICSDGGCREAGDVVKAFAAGADFVMMGTMFAGCDECEGEWHTTPLLEPDSHGIPTFKGDFTKSHLTFYGMSSKEAMEKYNGGMADYKASEGECRMVPYKGPAADILKQITGGLRSACTYTGSATLKDLSKNVVFAKKV